MKSLRYLRRVSAFGVALLAVAGAGSFLLEWAAQAQTAPVYRNIPLWPRPFADDSWVIGSVTGVATDAQNHVWVVHRGNESLEANERGMIAVPGGQGQPSSSVCCMAAPYVLEYDTDGRLISSWGGPSVGFQWPQVTGGIAVDAKGNVWIAAAGVEPAPAGGRGRGAAAPPPESDLPTGAPAAAAGRGAAGRGAAATPPPPDAHVLKFTRDGRYSMTIGTPGKMDGPDSQTTLNRPSAIAVDSSANEVFVADMGNRRVVVFDADKGTYKRHWFAYGEKTAGPAPGPYNAADPPAKSFRDITCIEIARDGMVYVCDKSSNRIQVFDKSGKFVKEGFVAKNTLGGVVSGTFGVINAAGSVWDVALSSDAQQRYLFVADGVNKKVRILLRDNLTEVGSIGSGGRYPGQFLIVNSVAVDSQGNLYTGETHHGKRVQKFVPGK
jgi:sugar lactone lactonase YvrE